MIGVKRLMRQLWYYGCRVCWLGSHRPRRLMQRDRSPDHAFDRTERLYIRLTPQHISPDQGVLPGSIRFPVQSVNRSRYSLPADVILPSADPRSRDWYLLGVAVFCVMDLPPAIPSGDGILYEFEMAHDPDFDNYSHSEVRAIADNNRREPTSQAVKKKYRLHIWQRLKLLFPPVT